MYGNNTFLSRLSILLAVLALQGLCSPDGRAQVISPTLAQGPTAANDRSGPDVASIHEELGQVTRLLQSQQEQLQRQSARVEQLERELAGRQTMAASPRFQLTPTTAGAPAVQPTSTGRLTQLPDSYADGETLGPLAIGGLDPCGPLFKIGGQYRVMFNASNFGWHLSDQVDRAVTDSQEDRTFFNQRFRTWMSVHPNDRVEGYIQVEMGHIGWGEDFDFPKTYGADRVGIEMRYGYLAYRPDDLGFWRVGIQPWQDSFGQTLASSDWDFSVGGFVFERTLPAWGDMRLKFGAFSLFEGLAQDPDDAMLFTWDIDWRRGENSGIGFSVYFLPDNGDYSYPTSVPYDNAWDAWFGARFNTLLGRLPINGFAIYNEGHRDDFGSGPDFTHQGAALKLEVGAIPLGCGNLFFQTLYSTGDRDPNDNQSEEFRTIAQSDRDNFGSQGYWSYLALTSPHGPSDVNDLGVGLQNRGLGLFTVQTKYDYPICGRLSATSAVGWLAADEPNPTSGAREMGTELVQMFIFDFGGGLVVEFGAAVLFTGDFYKTSPVAAGPDDLWEAFTRAQFEF